MLKSFCVYLTRIAGHDMKLMGIDSDILRSARKAFNSPVRERPLMITCYFYKLEKRLKGVRVRGRRRRK